MTAVRQQMNGWGKIMFAPLLSAFITGGIMYVAVRTELSAVAARQELVLRDIAVIRAEFERYRLDMMAIRERLATIETRVDHEIEGKK